MQPYFIQYVVLKKKKEKKVFDFRVLTWIKIHGSK